MSDFLQLAGWTQHAHPISPHAVQHIRSFSPSSKLRTSHRSPKLNKSASSSVLPTMAAVSSAPGIPTPRQPSRYDDDERNLSTIPDPRSRTTSPASESGPPSPSQHPDLSNEVATLSNKLINAINHQTNLDDSLSATRHELEAARERIQQLERQNTEQKDLVAQGFLIHKTIADAERFKLLTSLAEEKEKRVDIEKEKMSIEQELESLTTALFEEANKMVITAREEAQKEHDLVQRRNDQLKAQLADTESLLRSHQEQLAELKQVMEQMTEQRDEQTNYTAPSTPGLSKLESNFGGVQDSDGMHSGSISEPISPSYPTSFTHLLHPVLRTDLSAYDDFISLLRMSKNLAPGSRVSSGSYGGIGIGLGLGGHTAHNSIGGMQAPTNGSSTSLSTNATNPASSPVTPTTPASSASATSSAPTSLTPLKETKFYKRALAEDIEPTLRLENAPGLSWLARRTVLNAICDGNLVVEPMPPSKLSHIFTCSLCGESRKDPAHTRTHRFRTSENENAQRYPLCKYCLGRVRSTCDFLGFLRVLRDGLWRADHEEAERAAWEESVRLREQMFWSRIGGGVVPVTYDANRDSTRSPRVSQDERKEQEQKLAEELELTGEIQPKDVTPATAQPAGDARLSKVMDGPKDLATKIESNEDSSQSSRDNAGEAVSEDTENSTGHSAGPVVNQDSSVAVPLEGPRIPRDLTSSLQVASPEEATGEPKRLSLSIPGTFE